MNSDKIPSKKPIKVLNGRFDHEGLVAISLTMGCGLMTSTLTAYATSVL